MEELKKAPVTVLLILANILVFTAVEFTGGSEDTMHMLQCGAAYTPAIMQGEYYRIFTSMFLHFGPQHLGNNMLVLFVLGGRLERTVGKLKYLLIYLLGGNGWKSAVSVPGTGQCGFCSFGRCIRCSVCCDGCNDLCCDQGQRSY